MTSLRNVPKIKPCQNYNEIKDEEFDVCFDFNQFTFVCRKNR